MWTWKFQPKGPLFQWKTRIGIFLSTLINSFSHMQRQNNFTKNCLSNIKWQRKINETKISANSIIIFVSKYTSRCLKFQFLLRKMKKPDMHVHRISMELPILYFMGSEVYCVEIFKSWCSVSLSLQTVQTQIKCCYMRHFICVLFAKLPVYRYSVYKGSIII